MNSGIARHVIEHVPAFLREHPGLQLELSCSDRRVDVVAEGFDCVIRVGTLSDSSLVARPLGQYRIVNCASPAYLKEHGMPQSLEDLARHWMVHYVSVMGQRPPGFEYMEGAQCHYVPMQGVLTVNSIEAYTNGCLAGLGLIQTPRAGVRHLLLAGRLVEVLPQYAAEPMPVSLLYAHRRNLSLRVQVFMDWLGRVLVPYLDPA
jgi:DNA-binding transcriptional LysR family regulator